MRRSVIGLTLLLVAAGCGDSDDDERTDEAAAPPAVVRGDWHGTLHQRGFAPFRVAATVREASGNPVRYSGLDCSGSWRYLGQRDGAYRFREVIDAGRSDTCKGVGIVALRPAPGGRLAYVFRGGGVESRGELKRR